MQDDHVKCCSVIFAHYINILASEFTINVTMNVNLTQICCEANFNFSLLISLFFRF